MQVDKLVEKLKIDFPEYQYELVQAGAGWFKIFVKNSRGVSLGRISVDPQGSIWLKHYKNAEYEFKMEDRLFYLFWPWMRLDRVLQINFWDIVRQAKQAKREKIENIKEWRRQHPKIVRFAVSLDGECRVELKKRRKIETKWMGTFRTLLHEEIMTMVRAY
jgi:hypothetical protein